MAAIENSEATIDAASLAGMPPVALPAEPESTTTTAPPAVSTQPSRRPPLTEIYKLPVPVKTFPVPTYSPSNPVSILWIAYKWIGLLWSATTEPSTIHSGIWSPETCSVQVTDEPAMRALWEQGFFGKGNLSRSEPEWAKQRLAEGNRKAKSSVEHTERRRVERQQKKWERARLEQEAIRKQRDLEARLAAEAEKNMRENASHAAEMNGVSSAPVGPLELLRLPNSDVKTNGIFHANGHVDETKGDGASNGHTSSPLKPGHDYAEDDASHEDPPSPCSLNGTATDGKLKKQKSVRFSPTVDSTTFLLHDPPSPRHAALLLKQAEQPGEDTALKKVPSEYATFSYYDEKTGKTVEVVHKEHLQLTAEEAFFLVFGLGALAVKDPQTNETIEADDLFDRFRRYSYFPPRIEPTAQLGPDDPFLLQYAVYHHFRSLGWVPRAGHKFGVDWLLYLRGPVFDHAQFAVLVIPEYADPAWRALGRKHETGKSWTWFFGVHRVISQVHKKLVLAYVHVPLPDRFEEARQRSVGEALSLYKVREIMVSRWSANRNR